MAKKPQSVTQGIHFGEVTRQIVDGKVILTSAWASGQHTIDEMRALVAEHMRPVERKVGERVAQRYELLYDRTKMEER